MPRILFVLDVQEGFLDANTRPVLPAIEKLLRRTDWDGIIASRFKGQAGSLYAQRLGYNGMRSFLERALWSPVARAATFEVVKTGYSALTPAVLDYLQRFSNPQVHVCGFDTDGCVLGTCFALWDAGYAPILIESAVASTGGGSVHDAALEIARRSFGAGSSGLDL